MLLRSETLPDVIVIQTPEFPHQFLRTLADDGWQDEANVHDEIATIADHGRHSPAGDSELPPRLSAWRNRQSKAAVERRHLDTSTKNRLVNRHWHFDVEVVPFAPEQRMRRDVDRDVEIARRTAVASGVSFRHDAQTRTVGRPRWDEDRNPFGPHHAPLRGADTASLLTLPAGAAACRAGLREDHMSTRPANISRRVTLRASSFRRRNLSGPSATGADVLTRDDDLTL